MCKCTDRIAELERILANEQHTVAKAVKREQRLNHMLIKERFEYAATLLDLQDDNSFLRDEFNRLLVERSELKKMLRLQLEHEYGIGVDDEYAAQLIAELKSQVKKGA